MHGKESEYPKLLYKYRPFDEFTFDYMTGNIYDKVVVTINGEAGTSLGAYKITTIKPAGSVSEETENEVNPNTGAY